MKEYPDTMIAANRRLCNAVVALLDALAEASRLYALVDWLARRLPS